MSTDFYFWNKKKKEYIHGYGNHNRKDNLRDNWPIILAWVMMNEWENDDVVCVGVDMDVKMLKGLNQTNYYIRKFNENYASDEHGKFVENRYVREENE